MGLWVKGERTRGIQDLRNLRNLRFLPSIFHGARHPQMPVVSIFFAPTSSDGRRPPGANGP